MISRPIWASATLLAFVLHLVLFAVYINAKRVAHQDKEELKVVEINLGVLGNLPEKKEVKKPAPKPEPKPKPKKKKKPKPVPVKKVIKPKQKTEVLVQEAPAKIVEKIEEAPKPIEIVPPEPVVETPVEESQPAEVYKETTGIAAQQQETEAKIRARESYTGQVAAKFTKYKRYPRISRRRHEEGLVKLAFKLDKSGNVLSYEIASSSGHDRLDKEVLRMLEKAKPFPPFPLAMTQDTLNVTIPVSFYLK